MERSPKDRFRDSRDTRGDAGPSARGSSFDRSAEALASAPASVTVPILERRRRATNLLQPARAMTPMIAVSAMTTMTALARTPDGRADASLDGAPAYVPGGKLASALSGELATPDALPADSAEPPRSWDRARWVNEVRRFDTEWDVDAPRSSRPGSAARTVEPQLSYDRVMLVVYEWQNAEPGTLSWQFPDQTSAVNAARAMRNAVRWAVIAGTEQNVTRAREQGLLLAEPEPLLVKV